MFYNFLLGLHYFLYGSNTYPTNLEKFLLTMFVLLWTCFIVYVTMLMLKRDCDVETILATSWLVFCLMGIGLLVLYIIVKIISSTALKMIFVPPFLVTITAIIVMKIKVLHKKKKGAKNVL